MASFFLIFLILIIDLTISNAHIQILSFSNITRLKRQSACDGFKCASGECINEELECDGAINCKDGTDETLSCKNLPCQSYLFRCAYGACIDGTKECDGKYDCKDMSDEISEKCTKTGKPVDSNVCGRNKFTCKSKQCIDELDLCDGIKNCDDGSDETVEACSKLECPAFTYKCAYGGCVDGNARCNGKKDCVDNSDEEDCGDIIVTKSPVTTTVKTTTTEKSVKHPHNCIIPKRPENGFIVIGGDNDHTIKPGDEVSSGTLISFTCKYQHILTLSTNISYCIYGHWSHEFPDCERICNPITKNDKLQANCYKGDSKVSCEKPVNGTRARLQCAPFYEDISLKRNPNRYCIEGTWDRNMPNCEPECGMEFVNAKTLIIRGGIAKKDHWPWVVGVYNSTSKEQVCGGSIINLKVVVSAAHCFYDDVTNERISPNQYEIAAGKHYREYYHSEDKYSQTSEIESIEIPKEFLGDIQNFRADIAVVILKRKLSLSNYVRPICMDWGNAYELNQLKPGSKGVVLGWGYTTSGRQSSPELKILEVPFRTQIECEEKLPKKYKRFITTNDKICAGYINMDTAVCQGDSGGGLVFSMKDLDLNERYYLRGIVSVAPSNTIGSCDANYYTLYTRVSKYISFISEFNSIP